MYRNCNCSNMPNCENNMIDPISADFRRETNIDSSSCMCGFEEDSLFPTNPMFGQSYVPWQTMDKTYRPCVGLRKGTIFPELVSPYVPCQSIEEINFIRATNKIKEGCNNECK